MNPTSIAVVSILSVFVVLIFIIIIVFIKQNAQYGAEMSTNDKNSQSPIWIALGSLISFLMMNILLIPIQIAYFNNGDSWDESTDVKSIQLALITSNCMACGFAMLFYIHRLKQSFAGSCFKVSNNVVKRFIIATIIIIGGQFCSIVLRVIDHENDLVFEIGWVIYYSSTVMWLVEYIIITMLFSKRLFCLIVMQRNTKHFTMMKYNSSSTNASSTNNNNNHNSNGNKEKDRNDTDDSSKSNTDHISRVNTIDDFNATQIAMLELITKQTLLVILPSILSVITIFCGVIRVYTDDDIVMDVIWTVCLAATTSAFCASIWLSFIFAANQYKCACTKMETWLQLYCLYLAIRKINT